MNEVRETTVNPEIEAEIGQFLDTQGIDYRANVPEGTLLGEVEHEGGLFRFEKRDSLVRAGARKLPERTAVYDTRSGAMSMVATGQLRYQLAKTRQDGSRVYSLTMPQGIVPPMPIEDTCKICYVNRGNRHRNFYSEYDLLNHYQAFHTNEWNAMERDRDIKERREQGDRLERLILGLSTALNPGIASQLPADVREQIEGLQSTARKGKAS